MRRPIAGSHPRVEHSLLRLARVPSMVRDSAACRPAQRRDVSTNARADGVAPAGSREIDVWIQTSGHACMTGKGLIRTLRRRAKANGRTFKVDRKRGKRSHAMVSFGERRCPTSRRRPADRNSPRDSAPARRAVRRVGTRGVTDASEKPLHHAKQPVRFLRLCATVLPMTYTYFKKGDRYIVFKKGRRWHWMLWLSHYGPIAYCRAEGYESENAAWNSLRSAHRAAKGATTDDRDAKIDHDPSRDV